ncbi:uncharacterized protein TNCV_362781 [Trichonephila clavipes]|nr:uncharacterized protein TNCV_362781 [Trichonephila clavipes]
MDADSEGEKGMNNVVPVLTSFERSNIMKSMRSYLDSHSNGEGLGSNPGGDMNGCKCIVPSWHRGTINRRRAASPLVRLVGGEERWEAPDNPHEFSLKIGVETSLIVLSPVWCLKLRLTTGVT